MKRTIAVLLLTAVCLAMLAGCTEIDPGLAYGNEVYVDLSKVNRAEVKSVGTAFKLTGFDGDLLGFISENTSGNYMVSPVSFRYALGLLLGGAVGETKSELLAALGVKDEAEWTEIAAAFNGFMQKFADDLKKDVETFNDWKEKGWTADGEKEPFRALRTANSVWKRLNITEDFKDSYKDYAEKYYAAEYRTFTPDNAVELINEWAKTKTEGMIPEFLPKGYDTTNLAVVLMNALYFKDNWITAFSKGETKDGVFTTFDKKSVTKSFMTSVSRYDYFEDKNTQIVVLPMEGGVSMAFVLGERDGLTEKISKASPAKVSVTIPKIDLETSFENKELVTFLQDRGVRKLFSGEADLSGMIDWSISVTDIIQKTKIKLDEDGVEAAAVTMIATKDGAMIDSNDPRSFVADRPFSFYVYTEVNGITEVMFAGEIRE